MKTVAEIAKMHGISKVAVYNWIKAGLLHKKEKVIGIKTRVIIDPKDVVEFHNMKAK